MSTNIKPILFSAPMVQALLRGHKTQTRRLLKIKGKKGFFQFQPSDTRGYDWTFRRADHVWEDYEHEKLLSLLPVQVGDLLYVREAWAPIDACKHDDPGPAALYNNGFYRADYPCGLPDDIVRWRPSIHMPRSASRLTLTVTDVRVQRLQSITLGDICAEGLGRSIYDFKPVQKGFEAFELLWNSLHGPEAWNANPWLMAVNFDAHYSNVDRMLKGEAA